MACLGHLLPQMIVGADSLPTKRVPIETVRIDRRSIESSVYVQTFAQNH